MSSKKHNKAIGNVVAEWEKAHAPLKYPSEKEVKKWLGKQGGILKKIAKDQDAMDMWNKHISKSNDNHLKAAWLKMQSDNKRIDREKKIGKAIATPFKVMADLALMPGKVAAFSPLLPFLPLMKKELKKRHVKVPGNKLDAMENTARQFVQVVILKKPPLTHGVGIMDIGGKKHKLESMDADAVGNTLGKVQGVVNKTTDGTKGNTSADKAVNAVSGVVGKMGPYGAIVSTAINIIHAIINFFTGNKKKAAAAKKGIKPDLTPEEQDATQHQTEPDHDLAADTDKVQDVLVSAGVGNVKSDGSIVAEKPAAPDYGHGIMSFFRKLFHKPIEHTQALENLIQELEGLESLYEYEA